MPVPSRAEVSSTSALGWERSRSLRLIPLSSSLAVRAAAAPSLVRITSVTPDQTQRLLDPGPGTYDVAIRAVNSLGQESVFAQVPGYTVGDPAAGVTERVDWGLVSEAVTATEDWGQVSEAVTETEDWGAVA